MTLKIQKYTGNDFLLMVKFITQVNKVIWVWSKGTQLAYQTDILIEVTVVSELHRETLAGRALPRWDIIYN